MTSPMIDKENLIITQANEFALSAQRMSLQEKRLAFLLMALVRRKDEGFKTYHIPITMIRDYLEITNKDFRRYLKDVAERFQSRVIELDDGFGGWKLINWLERCHYMEKDFPENPLNVACLEMKLHTDLAPLLLNLKERFGSLPFRQLVHMVRFTSMRLAEILFHASFGGTHNPLYFNLLDLKKRLGLEGKYKNFHSFKKEVLIRAQQECKERAPITFDWREEKSGRKVIGLHFHIKKNAKISLPPAPPIEEFLAKHTPSTMDMNAAQRGALAQLEQCGVYSQSRYALIARYDPKEILQSIEHAKRIHDPEKGSLGGCILACMEGEWVDEERKKEVRQAEEEARLNAQRNAKAEREREAQQLEELKDAFDLHVRQLAEVEYNALDEATQEEVIAIFRSEEPPIMRKLRAKKDMTHASFRKAFYAWFRVQALSDEARDFNLWRESESGKSL